MKNDFSKSSASFKRRNPHLFHHVRPVEKPVVKPHTQQALDNQPSAQATSQARVVIRIRGLRKKLLDSDNFAGGIKPLRDIIAESLGVDDNDPRITWEYYQSQTKSVEGTQVSFHLLCNPIQPCNNSPQPQSCLTSADIPCEECLKKST